MKNYSTFKNRLLQNKKIRKEYENLAPEFAIAESIIKKRIENGLSQSALAKKIGTKQSAISRLESGNYNPSIKLLEKVAKALSLKLEISFCEKG
ncbi:MAG: helix-turn-helix transcriptional regulator [Candidatus Gracilibacteria bacterium]|nr:helix-turn-helix transcriptional regulator [Candidatus Gracilibacteria bacterium]